MASMTMQKVFDFYTWPLRLLSLWYLQMAPKAFKPVVFANSLQHTNSLALWVAIFDDAFSVMLAWVVITCPTLALVAGVVAGDAFTGGFACGRVHLTSATVVAHHVTLLAVPT